MRQREKTKGRTSGYPAVIKMDWWLGNTFEFAWPLMAASRMREESTRSWKKKKKRTWSATKKCKQRKQRRGIEQKKNKPFTKRTKGRRNVVNGARRQSDVALPAPWISFSPMIKIVFTYFPMRSLPFQTFLESIFTPTSRTAIIRSTGFFFQNSNYVWRWSVIISSDLVTDERW